MSVEGQIKDADVIDILQVICLRGRPTQLTVMRGGTTARVVVGNGQIVHAQVGPLTGEGAVVELLGWREGIFTVSEVPSLPERNVHAALTELMVRLSRLPRPAPEGEDDDAPQPSLPRDGELDEALVDLCARLERDAARFETVRPGSKGVAAVPILESVLARIVQTGSAYNVDGFTEDGLRQVLAHQGEMTPALKLAGGEKGRVSLEVFRELLASHSLAGEQRAQLFAELTAGVLGVVNALFVRLSRRLESDDLRQQWRETFEAFLTDLAAALDAVKL